VIHHLKLNYVQLYNHLGLMCTYGDFKCILARDLKKFKVVVCILIMCKEYLRYMEHIPLGLYNSSQGLWISKQLWNNYKALLLQNPNI
jgi:hypothetical protein